MLCFVRKKETNWWTQRNPVHDEKVLNINGQKRDVIKNRYFFYAFPYKEPP